MPTSSTVKNVAITEPNSLLPVTKPIGADADNVDYDNTDSGLTATNIQDAIDEINSKCPSTLEFDTIALVSSLPIDPDSRTLYLTTS